MSSVYRLNADDLEKIKSILRKERISSNRVIIDLDEKTIRSEDSLDNSDLLEIAGSFSSHRAKELLEVIKESRGEWG